MDLTKNSVGAKDTRRSTEKKCIKNFQEMKEIYEQVVYQFKLKKFEECVTMIDTNDVAPTIKKKRIFAELMLIKGYCLIGLRKMENCYQCVSKIDNECLNLNLDLKLRVIDMELLYFREKDNQNEFKKLKKYGFFDLTSDLTMWLFLVYFVP